MRVDPDDIKELNLLKHYRIIRKWACKNNNLTDAELELLIYLDCKGMFTKHDFEIGTYSYSWNNRRWNKLLKEDWISVWRKQNRTTQKYNIYKVSLKCKQLIARMYRIMLGEENMSLTNISKKTNYMHKVTTTAAHMVNNDNTRNNGI